MDANIRFAAISDLPFLLEHDRHVAPGRLHQIVRAGHVYVLSVRGEPVGWLRWGFFWDNTPFMNMLYLLDGYRMQGYGRMLVREWEELMQEQGHTAVMTSTQANEGAQHFYRHLGYEDIGGFLQPGEAYELILFKTL